VKTKDTEQKVGVMHDLDLFQDTTSSLELERFKRKLQDIWARILEQTYTEDDGSYEEYCAMNALNFGHYEERESEIDNLMMMLEDMMADDEDISPVKSGGKAPTYGGSQLKAVSEGRKTPTTVYKETHVMTATPKDSQTKVSSGTYKTQSGNIAPRKDAKVIRSFSTIGDKFIEELKDLKERQAIGRRKQLFRL